MKALTGLFNRLSRNEPTPLEGIFAPTMETRLDTYINYAVERIEAVDGELTALADYDLEVRQTRQHWAQELEEARRLLDLWNTKPDA